MAPTDPRMLSNHQRHSQESAGWRTIVSDSLVYRYPAATPRIDGLPGEEGTFNMCSFWLVEALTPRRARYFPEKLDQARFAV